jgi:hypothetical protein
MKITITIIAITFMPLIFVAQVQEVKSQDNPVMQVFQTHNYYQDHSPI